MGEAEILPPNEHESVADLIPVIRRVVAARVRNPTQVDDIVQETLARMMAARSRVEGESLVPYAVVTARNLIVSAAQREQRAGRSAHLLPKPDDPRPRPEDEALREAGAALVKRALDQLPRADRQILLAHELEGRETAAGDVGAPGAHGARPGGGPRAAGRRGLRSVSADHRLRRDPG